MSLIYLAFLSNAFTTIFVIFPGLLISAYLIRSRILLNEYGRSEIFILSTCFGILITSIAFLLLFWCNFLDKGLLTSGAFILFTTVFCGFFLSFFRLFGDVRDIIRRFIDVGPVIVLLVGLVVGGWAFIQFPHTFDSGQLLWTQHVLWGEHVPKPTQSSGYTNIGSLQPMIGFSALLLPLGALLSKPLVLVAASLKPFLVVVLIASCIYVARLMRVVNLYPYILTLFIMIISSTFGLHGIIDLGKDSIYGILYCTLFLAILSNSDRGNLGIQIASVFAAASLTGVIAVPYMGLAVGLWLAIAANQRMASDVMLPLMSVNAATLPLIAATMTGKAALPLYAIYLVAFGVIYVVVRRPWPAMIENFRSSADRYVAFVPLALIASSAELLPISVELIVWRNADGSPVTEVRPPFDGQTSFAGLFFEGNVGTQVGIGVAFFAIVILSLSRRLTRSQIAVVSMPFAAITLALLHKKFDLHILTSFNIWDLVKDVPMWLGGSFFQVIAVTYLAGILANTMSAPRGWSRFHGYIASGCITAALPLLVIMGLPDYNYKRYISYKNTFYDGQAASTDRDLFKVSGIIMNELVNKDMYMDKFFLPGYFYSMQMFGASVNLYSENFPTGVKLNDKTGFGIGRENYYYLIHYAKQNKFSLDHRYTSKDGNSSFFIIDPHGDGSIHLPADDALNSRIAFLKAGAYGQESAEGKIFRWARKNVVLEVPMIENVACVTFQASGPSTEGQQVSLTITDDAGGGSTEVAFPSNGLDKPSTVSVTVRSTAPVAKLNVVSSVPERQFPNDARSISWAIFEPINVAQGKACSTF